MDFSDAKKEVRKRWNQVSDKLGEGGDQAYKVAERFVDQSLDSASDLAQGVSSEGQKSKEMARTFFRMLSDKLNLDNREEPPAPEEVKAAIHQLKDVGRVSFFVSFSVLPGGAALLIALELLARKYGIDWFTFVPSSFRQPDDEAPNFDQYDRNDEGGSDKWRNS